MAECESMSHAHFHDDIEGIYGNRSWCDTARERQVPQCKSRIGAAEPSGVRATALFWDGTDRCLPWPAGYELYTKPTIEQVGERVFGGVK
jgi:hypothetical protein